jgi:hypothetical protein
VVNKNIIDTINEMLKQVQHDIGNHELNSGDSETSSA